MTHLAKNAGGHLLKNADGHLVKCPAVCPDNCDTCDDPITLTVTGFTDPLCVACNGVWTLNRTGCVWTTTTPAWILGCTDNEWGLFGVACIANPTGTAPNVDGCPPAVIIVSGSTLCPSSDGTAVLS